MAVNPADFDPRLDVGRRFSSEARSLFLGLVAQGKSRAAALRAVDGVGIGTLEKVIRADAGFREALEAAERVKWDLAEDRLYEALEAGEPWAVKEVLHGAGGLKERWKPPASEAVVGVEVGPGVERVMALQASLEQRRAELEAGGVLDVESTEAAPGK